MIGQQGLFLLEIGLNGRGSRPTLLCNVNNVNRCGWTGYVNDALVSKV